MLKIKKKHTKPLPRTQHTLRMAVTGGGLLLVLVAALVLFLPEKAPPAIPAALPSVQAAEAPVAQTTQPTESERVQAALQAAQANNRDVVAWLTVDGAEIDDPVAQAGDNDKYLRRTIESADYDIWGCYFADFECDMTSSEALSPVTIIYGHALDDAPDAEKFSKLKRYKDRAFAAAHPVISLGLNGELLRFAVFAASNIPVTTNYIDPTPARADYQATLDYLLANSFTPFGVSVNPDDKILILSTCTSDKNTRFVVAAKLVEDAE